MPVVAFAHHVPNPESRQLRMMQNLCFGRVKMSPHSIVTGGIFWQHSPSACAAVLRRRKQIAPSSVKVARLNPTVHISASSHHRAVQSDIANPNFARDPRCLPLSCHPLPIEVLKRTSHLRGRFTTELRITYALLLSVSPTRNALSTSMCCKSAVPRTPRTCPKFCRRPSVNFARTGSQFLVVFYE